MALSFDSVRQGLSEAGLFVWKTLRLDRSAPLQPDFIIGETDKDGNKVAYLKRWFVIPRNKKCNIYLHRFCRSDDDRALHTHPWWNVSILLSGSYREWMPWCGTDTSMLTFKVRKAGYIVYRNSKAAHRIELIDGPVWTLFITGPKVREWGFLCPKGFVHWKKFTASGSPGEIGPGCDGGNDNSEEVFT